MTMTSLTSFSHEKHEARAGNWTFSGTNLMPRGSSADEQTFQGPGSTVGKTFQMLTFD